MNCPMEKDSFSLDRPLTPAEERATALLRNALERMITHCRLRCEEYLRRYPKVAGPLAQELLRVSRLKGRRRIRNLSAYLYTLMKKLFDADLVASLGTHETIWLPYKDA